MTARSRMTYRALVERIDKPNTDPWGGGAPSWSTHYAALPCYPWSRVKREAVDADRSAVVEDLRMIVPVGTDITEADRVNGITDRLGATHLPGLYNVRAVQVRATHKEVALEAVA